MSDSLTGKIRQAYSAGAGAWASGPEAVYQRLADALVGECPVRLEGARVLDVGSGTGVATRALLRKGAAPLGFDLTWEMLAEGRDERPPGVSGDAGALPFGGESFDAIVAACCINHFDPREPLRDWLRVLRPGGGLAASSFPADRPHPLKAVIEAVLLDHGWEPPAWYAEFMATLASITGDPVSLATVAEQAGFTDVEAYVLDVEAGVDDPERMLAWRLWMPHTIGFVEGLEDGARRRLLDDARAAVSEGPSPSVLPLLVLRGVRP